MKAVRYGEIPPTTFDDGKAHRVASRVAIGKADGAANFCMRVFEIGPGGHTPRHGHPWEHEIFCHAGRGEVFCDERWTAIGPGSVVFVPPGAEHQVRNAGDEPLVFACLVPSSAPEL